MSLDIQVQILSVDTGNFYSNKEARLHWKNHALRIERNGLKKKEDEILNKLFECGVNNDDLNLILDYEYDFEPFGDNAFEAAELGEEYRRIKELIKLKNKKIKIELNA